MAAGAKPYSISCACHSSGDGPGGMPNQPVSAAIQTAMANAPNRAAQTKNIRNG